MAKAETMFTAWRACASMESNMSLTFSLMFKMSKILVKF